MTEQELQQKFLEWMQAGQPSAQSLLQSELMAPLLGASSLRLGAQPELIPSHVPQGPITPSQVPIGPEQGMISYEEAMGRGITERPLPAPAPTPRGEAPSVETMPPAPGEALTVEGLAPGHGPGAQLPSGYRPPTAVPRPSPAPTPAPGMAPYGAVGQEPTMPRQPMPVEEEFPEVPKGPYEQPEYTPFGPEMGIREPEYFQNLQQQRIQAFPGTTAAALQSVGRTPGEFRLKEYSPFMNFLMAGTAGMLGEDLGAIRDTEQARLHGLEREQLDWALKKASHKDQITAARIQMEREQDTLQRQGLAQQAERMLQSFTPGKEDDPRNAAQMQRIIQTFSTAYRLPPKYIKKYLSESWDPATGTYKYAPMTAHKQWVLENKAKAEYFKELYPGYPDDVYYTMAIKGAFPDWANDTSKVIETEMARAYASGDTEKYQKLVRDREELVASAKQYRVRNFTESLKMLVDNNALSREDYDNMIRMFVAEVNQMGEGAGKALVTAATERYKAEKDLEKERLKEGAVEKPLKPREEMDRLSLHTQLAFYAVSLMDPASFVDIKTNKYDVEGRQQSIDMAKARVKANEFDENDVQLVQRYMNAQWKSFHQWMPKTAAVMEQHGLVPADPDKMDMLYNMGRRSYAYKDISDDQQATNLLAAIKAGKPTQ